MRSLVLILVVAMFAGCVQETPTDDATIEPMGPTPIDAPASGDTPAAAEATVPETTVVAAPDADDWFRLTVTASPEGSLTGFEIPVPEGAAVPAWYDEDKLVPWILIVPMDDHDLEARHMLFTDADGNILLENLAFASDSARSFGASANERAHDNHIGATFESVEAHDGDTIYVLLGAIGNGEATFGLRYLESDPFLSGDLPAPDADAFLEAADQGWDPVVTGESTGLTMAVYYDSWSETEPAYEVLFGPGRFVYGDWALDEPVPVRGPHIITEAATGHDGQYGSALAWVWYNLHGGTIVMEASSSAGAAAMDSVAVADPVVQAAIVASRGDAGPSGIDVDLDLVGMTGRFPRLVVLSHVAMDVPASSVLGIDVKDETFERDQLPVGGRDAPVSLSWM